MFFLAFILMQIIGHQVHAQSNGRGTCIIWGDPHLVSFPADPSIASFRSGYWCRWPGRMLIVQNTFIEFYVNVTDYPYWNEYYEIYLFHNSTKLCTITSDNENCPREFVTIERPHDSPNSRQIFYDLADIEISIYSQWVGGHLMYNIDLIQTYSLILNSTGLCVNRRRECIIETSGRRKREVNIATATEVCDLFIAEANQTAKQLVGNTISSLTSHAREACITDISLTGDVEWGKSAVWFILVDSIQQASLSRDQQREKMMNISSSIDDAVRRAQPRAESILGISTTTTTSLSTTTITTEFIMNSSTITSPTNASISTIRNSTIHSTVEGSTTTSSSSTMQLMHNIFFLFLMLPIQYIF